MSMFSRACAVLTAAVLLILSGITHAAEEDNPVVATINGKPITEQALQAYARQRSGDQSNAGLDRQTVMNEVITRELLYQEAVAKGIDERPEIQAMIEHQTHTMLANLVVQQLLQSRQPSRDELQSAYEAHIKDMGNKEYKARHILVDSEAAARSVIDALDEGQDFAQLAKEKSTGPSGESGGDLGWFSASAMVKPFAAATRALEVGSYTKEPVQTRFGWHVIRLEDTRDIQPPAFDDLRDQLVNSWRTRLIQDYIGQLRDTAEIKSND